MKITWEVEDGYVGGSRPQSVTIPKEELEGLEGLAREHLIEAYIQDSFEQTVSWREVSREG